MLILLRIIGFLFIIKKKMILARIGVSKNTLIDKI